MAASIVQKIARIRVSSVLNKDVKQFGKQHLLDSDDETCWNSDQGSPQWILAEFEEVVRLSEIHVQFQGGFVGKECWLESGSEPQDDNKKQFGHFFSFSPEDNNQVQVFKLSEPKELTRLKIVFSSSSDFFGRITIYKLDLLADSL